MAADDFAKMRSERIKKQVLNALKDLPGLVYFDPYLVLYKEGEGMDVLRFDKDGLKRIFSDRLP